MINSCTLPFPNSSASDVLGGADSLHGASTFLARTKHRRSGQLEEPRSIEYPNKRADELTALSPLALDGKASLSYFKSRGRVGYPEIRPVPPIFAALYGPSLRLSENNLSVDGHPITLSDESERRSTISIVDNYEQGF